MYGIDYKTYRKLPTRLYTVKVPAIATYDPAELELIGVPVDYKDGKVAKEGYLDYSTVMLPIRKILNIYDEGYPIKLINKDDSADMYNSLERYVKDWSVDLRYSPNMKVDDVDNDYLMLIDKFLSEMFGFNKDVIVKDMVKQNSAYQMNVGVMNPIGMGNANNQPIATRGKAVGMMAAYGHNDGTEGTVEESPITSMYRNPSQPMIDLDKVERATTIKPRSKKRYSLNDL